MSEQGFSPENNPAVAGPSEGAPGAAEQQQVPQEGTDGWWQHQYQQLQPEYTRSQQENVELRHQQELYDLMISTDDPDTRRAAALELGYQLAEEEIEPDEYDDPFEVYDDRIARLEESTIQRQQAEEEAVYGSAVRALLDERLDAIAPGLDKEDQDMVLAYAMHAIPMTEEVFMDRVGLPDIGQAYEFFQAREDARQKAWAQTKRTHHISPVGQQATEVPNLDNDQERRDWMVAQLQSTEQ